MKKNIGWYYLVQLGNNMWVEPLVDSKGIHGKDVRASWSPYANAVSYMRFEEDYWKELTLRLKDAGCTAIVLDIGEGVRFDSHPELALEDSWSKQKLSDEISRLRSMGFEVLPKLNFSAGHDLWLGEYSRMLSTSIYYKVTNELITETAELFDNPRLFHLGMDEEDAGHQQQYNYVVVRQGEQWWYDFNKLVAASEAAGCRPWVWSDYAWRHEELFFKNMSKEIVQSNWYYEDFRQEEPHLTYTTLYDKLEAAGYDQIPTGSTWSIPDNLQRTVEYCGQRIAPERLLGYMQTPWYPTLRACSKAHDSAIADLANAVKLYNK